MRTPATITAVEIRKLFKKYLNISLAQPSLYRYIHKHNFPKPALFGRPRLWLKTPVLNWFKKAKKFNSK